MCHHRLQAEEACWASPSGTASSLTSNLLVDEDRAHAQCPGDGTGMLAPSSSEAGQDVARGVMAPGLMRGRNRTIGGRPHAGVEGSEGRARLSHPPAPGPLVCPFQGRFRAAFFSLSVASRAEGRCPKGPPLPTRVTVSVCSPLRPL